MYSRNIPMGEKRIVCFQSKQVKICSYYIYLKRYFEKIVTNDFRIFWRTAALTFLSVLNVHHSNINNVYLTACCLINVVVLDLQYKNTSPFVYIYWYYLIVSLIKDKACSFTEDLFTFYMKNEQRFKLQ